MPYDVYLDFLNYLPTGGLGWLDFLKFSVDRVLKNHALDGVYYDWNAALLCSNPSHVAKGSSTSADNSAGRQI